MRGEHSLGIVVDAPSVRDLSEELHAHERVDEEEKEEQHARVAQPGERDEKRLEELVERLGLAREAEQAADANRADRHGDTPKVDVRRPHEHQACANSTQM